jgi:hypothetical protein
VSEFEDEAERLPKGEHLLWEGRPQWWPLAVRAFHVRKVALYFVLFMAWHFASNIADGAALATASVAALWLLVPGGLSVAVLCGLAMLYARTTRYRVTTRRVLMQFGVALPITLNVPLRIVGSASLKSYADGTGDIPLVVTGKERAAYLLLWPHVRPWKLAKAEPMLRAVPDGARVAELLAKALVAATNEPRPPVAARLDVPAGEPQPLTAVAA